ncbi:MAG: MotB family protein [bacterium]
MSEECECEECEEGLPPWLATFADLMSLLMCFFVLLLSFSEMDVQSYKRMAGSMKAAFGVQREVKVEDPPKATSIIAKEFSPGKPTPTVLRIVQQEASDNPTEAHSDSDEDFNQQVSEEMEDFAEMLSSTFEEEIESGALEVVLEDGEIKIRLNEKVTFPSGSAKLQRAFKPVLKKVAGLLSSVDGRIVVAGHTDDVPIRTSAFPSNWELSAARAASVVHMLSKSGLKHPERLEIRAFADNLPIAKNDSKEHRAMNRRVEIIISAADGTDPLAETINRSEAIRNEQPDQS